MAEPRLYAVSIDFMYEPTDTGPGCAV